MHHYHGGDEIDLVTQAQAMMIADVFAQNPHLPRGLVQLGNRQGYVFSIADLFWGAGSGGVGE